MKNLRKSMRNWMIVCLVFAALYFQTGAASGTWDMAVGLMLFFATLAVMFYILAKTPKESPFIFGKENGVKKTTFVVLSVLIAFILTGMVASGISAQFGFGAICVGCVIFFLWKKHKKEATNETTNVLNTTVRENYVGDQCVFRPDWREIINGKFQKPVCLLVGVAILGTMVPAFVISLFRRGTENEVKEELQASYEIDVQEAFDNLLAEYDVACDEYEKALVKYEADIESYNDAKAAHTQEKQEYDEDYDVALAAYEVTHEEELAIYKTDLETYDRAVEEREKAIDEAYAAAEKAILKEGVDFTISVSERMTHNNSVGHEWYTTTRINGTDVWNNDTITLKLGSRVSFKSVATENDNIPDSGSASSSYTLSEEDFENGFKVTQTVSVRENRGRYSGNTAGWEFTYTLKPVKYTVTIDQSNVPERPIKPVLPKYTPPTYDPPKFTLSAPVEPVLPVEPTMDDISVQAPDLDSVTVSVGEIFHRNRLAGPILVICLGLLAFLAIKIVMRIKVLYDESNAEYLAQMEAAAKASFYQKKELPAPPYDLQRVTRGNTEEEKRLNLQFAEFLHLKNLRFISQETIIFLREKMKSAYLKYDESLMPKLQETLATEEAKLQSIEEQIQMPKDPLAHLLKIEGYEACVETPIFGGRPFFAKSSNKELSEFLQHTNVRLRYFSEDEESVFVLTPFYLLEYLVNEHRFNVHSLNEMSLRTKNGTAKLLVVPDPERYDVIDVKWLHMTKSGNPDKRYTDNPATWTVYEGMLVFKVKGVSKEVVFYKKDALEAYRDQIRDYLSKYAKLPAECGEKYLGLEFMANYPDFLDIPEDTEFDNAEGLSQPTDE